jgi:2-hydroxy-6-oxonona-2,4-dienedioate hydrolase
MSIPTGSRMVETSSGLTHVITAGPSDAPPLVMLHGMNGNAMTMAPAIVALARSHHVYAVDTIGMPGRSAETRLPRAGDGYPGWLLEVLDRLGLARAGFVGLSFGGWLMLRLAALAPERIAYGVLLDSGGLTPFTLRGQMISGMAAMRYLWFPSARARHAAAVRPFYAAGTTPDEALVDFFALGFRHVRFDIDPKGLPPVAADALARLRAPLLVLYGEHDLFFDARKAVARARMVLPNLAGAEIIPGQGHVLGTEAYDRVYGQIAAFCQSQV